MKRKIERKYTWDTSSTRPLPLNSVPFHLNHSNRKLRHITPQQSFKENTNPTFQRYNSSRNKKENIFQAINQRSETAPFQKQRILQSSVSSKHLKISVLYKSQSRNNFNTQNQKGFVSLNHSPFSRQKRFQNVKSIPTGNTPTMKRIKSQNEFGMILGFRSPKKGYRKMSIRSDRHLKKSPSSFKKHEIVQDANLFPTNLKKESKLSHPRVFNQNHSVCQNENSDFKNNLKSTNDQNLINQGIQKLANSQNFDFKKRQKGVFGSPKKRYQLIDLINQKFKNPITQNINRKKPFQYHSGNKVKLSKNNSPEINLIKSLHFSRTQQFKPNQPHKTPFNGLERVVFFKDPKKSKIRQKKIESNKFIPFFVSGNKQNLRNQRNKRTNCQQKYSSVDTVKKRKKAIPFTGGRLVNSKISWRPKLQNRNIQFLDSLKSAKSQLKFPFNSKYLHNMKERKRVEPKKKRTMTLRKLNRNLNMLVTDLNEMLIRLVKPTSSRRKGFNTLKNSKKQKRFDKNTSNINKQFHYSESKKLHKSSNFQRKKSAFKLSQNKENQKVIQFATLIDRNSLFKNEIKDQSAFKIYHNRIPIEFSKKKHSAPKSKLNTFWQRSPPNKSKFCFFSPNKIKNNILVQTFKSGEFEFEDLKRKSRSINIADLENFIKQTTKIFSKIQVPDLESNELRKMIKNKIDKSIKTNIQNRNFQIVSSCQPQAETNFKLDPALEESDICSGQELPKTHNNNESKKTQKLSELKLRKESQQDEEKLNSERTLPNLKKKKISAQIDNFLESFMEIAIEEGLERISRLEAAEISKIIFEKNNTPEKSILGDILTFKDLLK